ncbi:hypothetical protein [Nitratidesulfovibrio liaohensis]|uniref:Uncharacterized protein n=1 Tax=Nitratidesulfovibrio liaohensis TaxID=2604158 RepID=A0ABY9R219_9BACT|nr:hypothetical protein [Nitratidesulfovibrio liaohensis]WMW65769.1 hypothetical protein KPS_000280 [Nitratidesulfovibrio liaohensis]
MTFTPLELVLLTGFISAVIALGVRIWLGSRFVPHEQCRLQHDASADSLDNVNTKLNILFRMLRALVVHSDIPKDTQAQILNTRADDKE